MLIRLSRALKSISLTQKLFKIPGREYVLPVFVYLALLLYRDSEKSAYVLLDGSASTAALAISRALDMLPMPVYAKAQR